MDQKWKFEVGDVVKLKKPHPCGSHEWEILLKMHGMWPSGHD